MRLAPRSVATGVTDDPVPIVAAPPHAARASVPASPAWAPLRCGGVQPDGAPELDRSLAGGWTWSRATLYRDSETQFWPHARFARPCAPFVPPPLTLDALLPCPLHRQRRQARAYLVTGC